MKRGEGKTMNVQESINVERNGIMGSSGMFAISLSFGIHS